MLRNALFCIIISTALCAFSCKSNNQDKSTMPGQLDASTPEGAILLLEKAYINKDLEGAIKLKDFKAEAYHMLREKFGDKLSVADMNDDLVLKTAEVLELSFRKQMEQNGFPDFTNLKCAFPVKHDLGDGYWRVTEKCLFPDGGYSEQDILVYFNGIEYRVLIPME